MRESAGCTLYLVTTTEGANSIRKVRLDLFKVGCDMDVDCTLHEQRSCQIDKSRWCKMDQKGLIFHARWLH